MRRILSSGTDECGDDEHELGGKDLIAEGLLRTCAVGKDLTSRLDPELAERARLPALGLGEFRNENGDGGKPGQFANQVIIRRAEAGPIVPTAARALGEQNDVGAVPLRREAWGVTNALQCHRHGDRTDASLECAPPRNPGSGRVLTDPRVELRERLIGVALVTGKEPCLREPGKVLQPIEFPDPLWVA